MCVLRFPIFVYVCVCVLEEQRLMRRETVRLASLGCVCVCVCVLKENVCMWVCA